MAVSHPEEIWGHQFQLGVLGGAVNPPKWVQGNTLVKVKGEELSECIPLSSVNIRL